MANLLGLTRNQFNLMERKFFKALAFDASVPIDELAVKLDAVNNAFINSLVNNGKSSTNRIKSTKKFSCASTTDSSSLV
jgi:hypothetical protein